MEQGAAPRLRPRLEPYVALARVENRKGLMPRDAPRLRARLSRLLTAPVNVRVTLRWVEAAVFRPVDLRRLAALLEEEAGGSLLHASEGEPEPPRGVPLPAAYRMLVIENRFWEAHVVGEAIWRRVGVVGRVLAVLAGAYARAQEGAPESGRAMIAKAVSWLPPRLRSRVEGKKLDEELERLYNTGWAWPLPWLEPLVAEAERLLPRYPSSKRLVEEEPPGQRG